MKTLFDAHGKKKRVEVTATEMVTNLNQQRMKGKDLDSKIVCMYFKIVRRTVLAGFDWRFPLGLKLSIRKKRKPGAHGLTYKRGADGYREKIYNPNRPNEHYTIEMYGSAMENVSYLFKSCKPFRRLLSVRLFNTDTPYSTMFIK